MKSKTESLHHKKIQSYIWNRKNKAFSFGEMKKKIHHYSNFGGSKYKRWIKAKYNLREFKKEGKIMLQKIPKKEKQQEQN
jgi:hypothetical protein